MCEKRGFPSKSSARKSITEMKDSVRVYLCEDCHEYHCTKERNNKMNTARSFRARSTRKIRHDRLSNQD